MKKKNIAFLGLASVVSVAAVGAIGNYFYNVALNPKSSKDKVFDETENTGDKVTIKDTSGRVTEDEIQWFKESSGYEDVFIESKDNLKLHGYKIEDEKNDKWAIVVHGYMGNAINLTNAIKKFNELGYNVLAPDLRGHGRSEGNYIGMGWHDRLDILQWADYIIEKNENAKIVLYGISMGAGTVMMAVGEKLKDNIKVAIEDCGYTSAWEEFSYQLKSIYKRLPEFPIMQSANMISKIRAGYSIKEASAIEQLKKAKIPMLFIHGEKDEFVPYEMLEKVYEAAENCEKEKLVIKNAGHAKSFIVDPELYWNKVKEFLNKYIN
ncbi:MAG: alpha/beta hydrolase [Sarcina sp.]